MIFPGYSLRIPFLWYFTAVPTVMYMKKKKKNAVLRVLVLVCIARVSTEFPRRTVQRKIIHYIAVYLYIYVLLKNTSNRDFHYTLRSEPFFFSFAIARTGEYFVRSSIT